MVGYIISIIVTIVFGVTTIILVKRKTPVWTYSTRHIIGRDAEAPAELKFVFGQREVTEVYQTMVVFFNKGNEKYCGDLVPPGNSDINEAIIVQLKGSEILRPPTILSRSKGAVNFDVEQVKDCADSIRLHIPILNHNDGAMIEIWHTKYEEINIPNADIPLLKKFVRERPENYWFNLIFGLVIIIASIIGIALMIAHKDWTNLDNFLTPLIFLIALDAMIGFGLSNTLRYTSFPEWSRKTKITAKH